MKLIVLLSAYNGETYIREQLDSLLAQTLRGVEILVRDDGSTDGTRESLIEYAQRGALRWYACEENLGPARSFWQLIQDAPDAVELGPIEGRVDFNDVSFHYDNGVPVLSHIDLHVRPGECLAVVGSSGGGKTTLCQLVPRFYEVSGGSVTVDGVDVRRVTQGSLRRAVGILQQDVFMFAGTVRENIRYGRPDATDEEIVEAARRAEIHEEIMAMPEGYDTYIGERGVMLSGGQKQRVSIARVFLKNPRVLILDEATSALDTVTEQSIQRSLDELSKGRTTIIIAHRLSTVRHADSIAVIEDEHVVEQGSHRELMAKNGIYAGLVRAQEIGEEDEVC